MIFYIYCAQKYMFLPGSTPLGSTIQNRCAAMALAVFIFLFHPLFHPFHFPFLHLAD